MYAVGTCKVNCLVTLTRARLLFHPVLGNRSQPRLAGAIIGAATVLPYDEDAGRTGSYKVTDTLSHRDLMVEHVTIDGERLTTTQEHPFYTRELGWMKAGNLWKGAHLRKVDGSYGKVELVPFTHAPQSMYNLTVDEAHTFYVGDGRCITAQRAGVTGGTSSTMTTIKIDKVKVRVNVKCPMGGGTGNNHAEVEGPGGKQKYHYR